MEEWIDFMMATDDESDAQMAATIDSENLKNSEKGTGLTQLLGEGITLLARTASCSSRHSHGTLTSALQMLLMSKGLSVGWCAGL